MRLNSISDSEKKLSYVNSVICESVLHTSYKLDRLLPNIHRTCVEWKTKCKLYLNLEQMKLKLCIVIALDGKEVCGTFFCKE